jgi:hypothetical protein
MLCCVVDVDVAVVLMRGCVDRGGMGRGGSQERAMLCYLAGDAPEIPDCIVTSRGSCNVTCRGLRWDGLVMRRRSGELAGS